MSITKVVFGVYRNWKSGSRKKPHCKHKFKSVIVSLSVTAYYYIWTPCDVRACLCENGFHSCTERHHHDLHIQHICMQRHNLVQSHSNQCDSLANWLENLVVTILIWSLSVHGVFDRSITTTINSTVFSFCFEKSFDSICMRVVILFFCWIELLA